MPNLFLSHTQAFSAIERNVAVFAQIHFATALMPSQIIMSWRHCSAA